jgi:hypothetical protein
MAITPVAQSTAKTRNRFIAANLSEDRATNADRRGPLSTIALRYPYMETRAKRPRQTPPVSAVELRPDPEIRRKLSGPALRSFFRIAAAWRLSVNEQRALLGWPASSTFHKYKAGDHGALSFDTLTRLSLIIGIYSAVQVLYPEPVFADAWVRMPNSNQLFGGRPPLTFMVEGGIDALFRVRRLLDGRRGGWN